MKDINYSGILLFFIIVSCTNNKSNEPIQLHSSDELKKIDTIINSERHLFNVDKYNRKQGDYKAFYSNGNLKYSGKMYNDTMIGFINYYSKSGKITESNRYYYDRKFNDFSYEEGIKYDTITNKIINELSYYIISPVDDTLNLDQKKEITIKFNKNPEYDSINLKVIFIFNNKIVERSNYSKISFPYKLIIPDLKRGTYEAKLLFEQINITNTQMNTQTRMLHRNFIINIK